MDRYYKILGLTSQATEEEVKKAYKKLAKKYHPDVNSDPISEKKFKEITKAYDKIINHDPELDPWGFSSFFEDFDQFTQQAKQVIKGISPRKTIIIGQNQAREGGSYTVEFTYRDKHYKRYINLPKDLTHGQEIIFDQEGLEGIGEGNNGDLYIIVKIDPDLDDYKLVNNQYIRKVDVYFKTLILGGQIKVDNIDITIPKNTQNNDLFLLKEPNYYIQVVAKLPENITKEQVEILQPF